MPQQMQHKEFGEYYKDYMKDELGLSVKQIKVIQKTSKGIFDKDVKNFLDNLPSNGKTDNSKRITEFMNKKFGPLMAEVFMTAVYFHIKPDEVAFLRNLVNIKSKQSTLIK